LELVAYGYRVSFLQYVQSRRVRGVGLSDWEQKYLVTMAPMAVKHVARPFDSGATEDRENHSTCLICLELYAADHPDMELKGMAAFSADGA
jgi:hypothetical protein